MQSHSKKKTIGGHTYEVFMLPATAGLDTFLDLSRIVGPALGILVDGVGIDGLKSLADLEVGGEVFEKAARQLFQAEEKETVKALVAKLASVTQVDGKGLEGIYELHFQGRLGQLFKWLAFALEVNFGDFFGEFRTSLGGVLAGKEAGPAE